MTHDDVSIGSGGRPRLGLESDRRRRGPARHGKESVLQPAVPVLRICDVAKAKEFYLDFLGLTLDWEGIGATLVAVGVALVGGPDR